MKVFAETVEVACSTPNFVVEVKIGSICVYIRRTLDVRNLGRCIITGLF